MAAPKGNEFWKLRSKHGRSKIFSSPEVFLEEAYKYFEKCNTNPWNISEVVKGGKLAGEIVKVPTQRPYTIVGLCVFLNIDTHTFRNYQKDEKYKDFFTVFTHVREIIEQNQIEGATVGAYNANIIGRILGLSVHINMNNKGDTKIIVQSKEDMKELDKLKDSFEND